MRRRDLLRTASLLTSAALLPGRPTQAQSGFSACDGRVKPLVDRMTLDEKLGQMAQAELGGLEDEADVENYFLGSVLSGGGADPAAGNTLDAWAEAVEGLISRSLRTRLGIPILYGADAVHGHNNVLGAVVFPHNIGLGCTRNPDLVEQIGRITAEEMRATGITWTFAPCVAVPRDDRWGRTYEGFSEDPALVARLGAAAIRGLQTEDVGNPVAVLACAKHYVGDGGTRYGSTTRRDGSPGLDQGDTRVDETTLRRVHLPGYVAAIAAGVGSIMVSYSSWNGVKVSANPQLLTGLLKEELGFDGFLISDYYAIRQIDPDYKTAVETSINAGMDMAMEPAGYREFIGVLAELVGERRVPMSRIDDAVTRILRIKCAMDLLDSRRPRRPARRLQRRFGSAAHRAVARRAVRESLVLLKNDGVLPVADTAHVHVAGRGADDLGMQCGGWTIEWQGRAGDVTTGGTTILAAIRAAAPRATITHSIGGTGAEGADIGIAVVGELPYAEGVGDRADLALSDRDAAVVERMKAAGLRVVVVVLSGRPLILGPALEQADALLAAWLPGTEGAGVADVLFGKFPPTGKLGVSWPRSMRQEPINVGDADYDPQFEYGFGLSY